VLEELPSETIVAFLDADSRGVIATSTMMGTNSERKIGSGQTIRNVLQRSNGTYHVNANLVVSSREQA